MPSSSGLSKNIIRHGSDEPLIKPLELRAGPLTLLFDPGAGSLRHIRLGDHEVLRAIYAPVRDKNWGTIPPTLSGLKSEIRADSFRILFDVICRQGEIEFSWRGEVTGEATGQIRYSFDGQAGSRFQRNRIGICVLHPILECSGRGCTVKHVDGTEETGKFPRTISPHQPFFAIQTITYEIATTGISAEVQFAGEVFEMEDQRNWTDASFKTYCTPQSLPKPVTVEAGTKIQQSVALKLKGQVRPVLPVLQGRAPQLAISTTPVWPLPPIGYRLASHGQPLSAREIERLKWLRPSHLRIDLRLAASSWTAALQRASREAAQLNTGLHIALTLSDQAEKELRALAATIEQIQPNVRLWLIFHEAEQVAHEKWVRLAQPILQSCAPNVLLAAGSKEFFTELNRDRPAADAPWFPCYPVNPQVHLTDNTTMIENLAGQASTVETTKEISARPVVLSPITLRIPSTAEAVADKSLASELPADVDPRQMSLFGAGWTLGSISRLAATANIHSLTYFETTGWRGLMETEAGSPLPGKFPSLPGAVFPVYHVLADIAEFAGKQIYPTHSSHPLVLEGMTLFEGRSRRRILVANLTGETQEAKIKSGTCTARVRYLDETNAEEAMRHPESFRNQTGRVTESVSGKIELQLLPFALARIDVD